MDFRRFAGLFLKMFLFVLFSETVFRGFTEGTSGVINGHLLNNAAVIFLFSAAISCAVAFLVEAVSCRSRRAGSIVLTVLAVAAAIFYSSQVVYYHIFGTFYTMYSMMNGAQVAEFVGVILIAILQCLVPILLFLACSGLLLYTVRRREQHVFGRKAGSAACCGLLATVLILGTGGGILTASLTGGNKTLPSEEDLYAPAQYLSQFHEIQGVTRSFGLLTGFGLDVYRLATDFEPELSGQEGGKDPVEALNGWINTLDLEKTNKKTGLYAGKNLIYITAESFADFAVDEKYTPTLYKLQQEGVQFTNFYNPIWGVSTLDGEYVNCLSLIPKSGVWSLKESRDNLLPYALGNQLAGQGYVTKAYHDHDVYFYDRNLSHPNLGYDFKGQNGGFTFEKTWPESDLEMMEKTVPDFLAAAVEAGTEGDMAPFHVYYLTVSGHLDYVFADHDIARKNRELVEDMIGPDGGQLPERCKAYMAANIELDRAVESLLAQLENAGQLEDTVIVLAGDHYPYGLTREEISALRGRDVDETYELYESTMLLWTPGCEPETVEKACSNLDILPTLSNLFGLEYDSRLMMGLDMFSDEEGLVVFEDKNWLTDRGTRQELVQECRIAAEAEDTERSEALASYIRNMDRKVSDMFAASALILQEDYYRQVQEQK